MRVNAFGHSRKMAMMGGSLGIRLAAADVWRTQPARRRFHGRNDGRICRDRGAQ
jgi:hypothetical protein